MSGWSAWAKLWAGFGVFMLLLAIASAFAGDWREALRQVTNAGLDFYIAALIVERDRMEAALQRISAAVTQ